MSVSESTHPLATDDDTVRATLSFVPTRAGAQPLRVAAHVNGSADPLAAATADAIVDVRDQPWRVLFYDPRPSWMSTFVRRAVERDPRVTVTSRVVTSRDISTDAGRVPRLDDLSALSAFDAIVVGAPQGLTAADATALDAFLRKRGGSVVLLLDETTRGLVDRMTGVSTWSSATLRQDAPLRMSDLDSTNTRVATLLWPSSLPVGATTIATSAEHPVVWQTPIGAGTLVVSGALDAWRFRDAATGDVGGDDAQSKRVSPANFDGFWQSVVATAAAVAPPPLVMAAHPTVLAPGERFDVDLTVRDAVLASRPMTESDIRATIGKAPDSVSAVRLWTASPGHLRGQLRAPATPGIHHIRVERSGIVADVPVLVGAELRRAHGHASENLRDWASASGGAVVANTALTSLPATIAAALHPAPRLVTWHPMRSAWWILPFALALSGEWWLRRRRGLA